MLAVLALVSLLISPGTSSQKIVRQAGTLAPDARQIEWQHEELTAFIHFGPNTYTNREWGTGNENPNVFNPAALDTDQWVRTLKAAGFKKIILVAKHHDGFVLWPTRYTEHSVASSRWRGGRGDLVGAFVRSAHKYGLLVGFYLSPADLYQARPGGSYANKSAFTPRTIPTLVKGDTRKPVHTFHFRLDDYNTYYLNELYELLTQYGPVEEVWFDGANPLKDSGRFEPYDFSAWYEVVHALQPHAIIFPIDINWVGNEQGLARASQWSVIPLTGAPMPDQSTHVLDPGSPDLGGDASLINPKTKVLRWMPSECDVPLEKGWFWHPDTPPKSLRELQTIYLESAGRNCQLLLDVPPDRSGRFDDADVNRIRQFGAWVRSTFSHDVAAGSMQRSGKNTVTVDLAHPASIRVLGLKEDIRYGQRVSRFAVDAWVNSQWKTIANGTTIGYKRLLELPSPVVTSRIRVRVLDARDTPRLEHTALYGP